MPKRSPIPKEVREALKKRTEYACKLANNDVIIADYCRSLGLTPEEACYDTHILMYTEPYAAYRMSLNAILGKLTGKNFK